MEVGWIGVFGRKQVDGVIVHITEQGFPFTLSGQRFEIVFTFILDSDFTDVIKLVLYRQNVEKVVSQETRQNDTKDRRTKVQQTQTVQKNQQTKEKNRSLVTKKGQKKK